MTADPLTVESSATMKDAAEQMRNDDTGAILVVDGGTLKGIVTDRDIAVRGVADGRSPDTPVSEVCTSDPVTLTVDQTVEDAIRIARDQRIRRIPVVQDGRPAGIVSLGDLAMERDEDSALADISAAPQNS
ncbi:CBS domain-containing protein [Conexibacter sp. SYSU D00693]|uniref:CBS domain-containing protein n=1 Tax=Conexibacter sp. SYSU D00693 TaxID=2812560 RepID=UPI00196AFA7E|nr:CBS domain-containing protein [Conexibacter sp. SYSU D00693]